MCYVVWCFYHYQNRRGYESVREGPVQFTNNQREALLVCGTVFWIIDFVVEWIHSTSTRRTAQRTLKKSTFHSQ